MSTASYNQHITIGLTFGVAKLPLSLNNINYIYKEMGFGYDSAF